MDVFRSQMRAAVRARKEREAAAQANEEARDAAAAAVSDDDTAPPNGFEEILMRSVKRLVTIARSKMGRLGKSPLEACTLEQALIQASTSQYV
jgi:hypothetical protein